MTKNKTTRRALLASVLSLLLCVSMLVGSTFAWFTDSASTGVNTITAGNLDIDLYYGTVTDDAISYTEVVENTTKLFKENALWEPGYTEVAYLKVENNGSLALKAMLSVNFSNQVAGKNADGEDILLTDYLMYDLIEIGATEFYADRATARNAAKAEAKNIDTEQKEIRLSAADKGSDIKYYALVVYMPEETNNKANYRGDAVPSIDLGVTLIATQDTVEEDSWDELYDKGAKYPSNIKNDAGLKTALQTATPQNPAVIEDGNYTLPLTVPEGSGLVIDGGDFASTDSEGAALIAEKDSSLTINDADIDGDGLEVAINAGENSDLALNGGNYTVQDRMQIISTDSQADITITDGYYKGSVAVWLSDRNTVSISGGEFNVWAIIYGENATNSVITISGGKFKIGAGGFDAGCMANITITGGTFNIDPTSYVPATHTAVDNGDGTWTVTVK